MALDFYSYVTKELPNNEVVEMLTVVVDGDPKNILSTNEQYAKLKEIFTNANLSQDEKFLQAEPFVSAALALKRIKSEMFSVENNSVLINGEVVPPNLGKQIVSLARSNLPHTSLINFWENWKQTVSGNVKKCLYNFLEHNSKNGQPVIFTEDGCFIAWKAVRKDFYDIHSGTILNLPGTRVEVPRNEVDDNPNHHCSFGLHVAAWGYVQGTYYSNDGSNKYLMLKVNPKDVVSVPDDYNFQKMRVCGYDVLKEVDHPLAPDVSYVTSNGEVITDLSSASVAWKHTKDGVRPEVAFEDRLDEDDEDDEECEECGQVECECDESHYYLVNEDEEDDEDEEDEESDTEQDNVWGDSENGKGFLGGDDDYEEAGFGD